MRQRTDRDIVHACGGDSGDGLQIDVARGLQRRSTSDNLNRLPHLIQAHVVQHDAVHTQAQRFAQLVQVAHLDLDGQIRVSSASLLEGSGDRTCGVNVIILDHHHIVEA